MFSLDLDAWINEPIEDSESDDDPYFEESIFIKSAESIRTEKYHEPTEEEIGKVRMFKMEIYSKCLL